MWDVTFVEELQCKHPIGVVDMTLRVYAISMSMSVLLVGQCALSLWKHGWPETTWLPAGRWMGLGWGWGDEGLSHLVEFLMCDERLPFLIMAFRAINVLRVASPTR